MVRNGKKTNHQENQFVTSSFSTQPPLVQRTNHDTSDHEPASSTSSYSCAAKTHAVFEIRPYKHFTSTLQWQLNHHGVCIPKRRQVNESEKIKCVYNCEKQPYQKEILSKFYNFDDYNIFIQNFYF